MKYVIILVDGMADYKVESLGMKTPLEIANIPTITLLAQKGEIGMVQTIPEGMSPGSDIANLSVMGFDPNIYHKGRSPLEAASMGVDLSETDVTFRCNLVTLKGDGPYASKTIIDHSAGDITTEEAKTLIEYLGKSFETKDIKYYPGVSYRHLILWKNGPFDYDLTPPHDVLGQKIEPYLPKGPYRDVILDMMEKSYELLKDHPVNLERINRGLNPANSTWIWGEGKKPSLASFKDKYGVDGSVISAVDLIQGIGILAGLTPIKVEGATGTIHTNFDGKAQAAIDALKAGDDFIYIHLEAPDECGHQGDLEGKIKSIELIDEKVVSPVYESLKSLGEPFKILILPDHRTPVSLRTHTSDPVPYVLFDSQKIISNKNQKFTEDSGTESGNFFESGVSLADYFFKK
ncbi:MAG TPA: cofactor-independent phosphoglycerate mutase [Eubacteriaceae bacterium]|jgi:2,3-bisphosphoglycerate-independent phosphoglycerate mutase|nr:cofactor-independent phosphoglycerate mutase [Eubacteriaceae bacterium]